jgi:hypothetical protein
MRITAAVAEQLLLLQGTPDLDGDLAAALDRLGRDVVRAVPSCLTVSIALARPEDEISVSTTAGAAGPAAALASLAVPLSAGPCGDLLILRAGEAGAFLLLADDLGGLLGPGQPQIELDKHLSRPVEPSNESLAASVADLRVVDQAVGVLVDRGLSPEAAHHELWRRAGGAGTTVAAVSREMVASLRAYPSRS